MTRFRFPDLLASICLAAVLSGQDDTYIGKVAVPYNLAAAPLEEAEKALARRDFETATRLLDEVLERHWDKPIRASSVPRSGEETNPVLAGDRFTGAGDEVMDRLRALPPEILQTYLDGADRAARKLLEQGLLSESVEPLRKAAARFLLTENGRAAALALVDRSLEEGFLQEARMQAQGFRRAFLRHALPHVELLVMREVVALDLSRDRDSLRDLRASLAPAIAEHEVTIGARVVKLGAWIDEMLVTPAPTTTATPEGPDINLFGRRAWEVGFRYRTDYSEDFVSWGASRVTPRRTHCPVMPTVQDGVIYVNDGVTLSARSLFNGQPLWPPVAGPMGHFEGRPNRSLTFDVALAGPLMIGYLEGAPATRAETTGWGGFEPIEAIPTRKLVAVDRGTGRTMWSHHNFKGRTSEETELIARLTVNTPPLVRGDTLYVAATHYHGGFRQWLCAFDVSSGHLVWSTYLCTGQMELNMFGNPIKEAVPGWVGERDGVLYFSTNVGLIAAVDAGTGGIRWMTAYEQVPIPHTMSQLTRERLPGWHGSRPVFHGQRAFIAPADSYELYAVNLEEGSLERVAVATRTSKNHNAFVVGLHAGKLLVAGRNVVAIDPATLRVSWVTADLPTTTMGVGFVKGLPGVLGNSLIFTTSAPGAILAYAVDVRDGRFVGEQALHSRGREGHVVLTPEAALVGGSQEIHVFFDLARVEQRLVRETLANPDDPDVHQRLGDVRRQKGEWSGAIQAFERTLRLAEQRGLEGADAAVRARAALHGAWLELASRPTVTVPSGPFRVEDRFEKALEYATDPRQRVETLLRAMSSARERRQPDEWIALGKRILENHPEVETVVEGFVLELLPAAGNGRRLPAGVIGALAAGDQLKEWNRLQEAVAFYHQALIRFGRIPLENGSAWDYANQRIGDCIAAGGHTLVYADQEREAQRLLDVGRTKNDVAALRSVLSAYPQSTVVEAAYLELTSQLQRAGQHSEALRGIQTNLARFRNLTPPVMVQYIECLSGIDAKDSERQLLWALARRFPNAPIGPDGPTRTAEMWARSRVEASMVTTDRRVPSFGAGLERAWTKSVEGANLRLVSPAGVVPVAARDLVFAYGAGSLFALDLKDGVVRFQLAVGPFPRRTLWHDGRLIVLASDEAIIADAEGRELWRVQRPDSTLEDLGVGQGKVYCLFHDLFAGRRLTLRGYDLAGGEEVQEHHLDGFGTGELQVGDSHLLVLSRSDGRAQVLSALTGQRIGATFAISRSPTLPFPYLASADVLVDTSDRSTSARGTTRLTARQLDSEKSAWAYDVTEEEIHNGWSSPTWLALSLRERTDAASAKRLLVLDTEVGRRRLAIELDRRERATSLLLDGSEAISVVEKSSIYRDQTERFVRVVEISSGRVLWDSLPFVGASVNLEVAATASTIIVRKAAPQGPASGGSLYFFDRATGKAQDEIVLGDVPALRGTDGPGLILRPEGLCVVSDRGVDFYRPR